MTVQDLIILAIVLACVGALDRFVVPAEYKWFYRAVVVVLLILWVLRAAGVLGTRVL